MRRGQLSLNRPGNQSCSTDGVVALCFEIGDKTQLLALILAACFKKLLLIILGVWLPLWLTTAWLARWVPGSRPAIRGSCDGYWARPSSGMAIWT